MSKSNSSQKKRASKRKIALIGLSLFALFMTLYLGTQAYGYFRIITRYPITAWTQDHKADCAVVLTGGPGRIRDAVEQLYLQRVKKVIISGVNPRSELRDIFPQRAFYGDIDVGDIILEKRSLTTYGNAQQALPLVEALNCKDLVLITSRTHMFRAYQTFRAHFPKEIPIYKRSTVGRRYRAHGSRLVGEVAKTLFYDFWFF